MTNLHSGNARTAVMAGTLDGFTATLQTALARLDRERRSSFARPGQRAEAVTRFEQAILKAIEQVRGTDRVHFQAQRAADLATAQADEKTIRGLKADLALAAEHIAAMEGQLAIERGHVCEPLPQRTRPGPEWSVAAQVPPMAAPAAGTIPDGPVKPPTARKPRSAGTDQGGSTQRRTGRPGTAK